MWLVGEPGAARIDGGPALCYRGERSRLLRCARCSPVSRVHPFQSLIAAAFAPVGPGCGGACPGFREPPVRFPPLRSRPDAVGGGGGGSFEQTGNVRVAGALEATYRAVAVHAVDAASVKSILDTRVG